MLIVMDLQFRYTGITYLACDRSPISLALGVSLCLLRPTTCEEVHSLFVRMPYTCTCTHECVDMHIHLLVRILSCGCLQVNIYIYIHIHTYVNIHTYIHTYIHVYVYIYIYIYILYNICFISYAG